MKLPLLISLTALFFSCGNGNTQNRSSTSEALTTAEPIEVPNKDGMAHAYFASGCFWCVEAVYESVEGVQEAVSGYAGGEMQNPTYENSGKHAETVEVIYDPNKVDYETLVNVYFGSQDPTQVNGQGPDNGVHYRSIIFYQNPQQKQIIEKVKEEVGKNYDKPIAAEVLPFLKFWKAEDYHQNYEKLHPENPYIQNVSIPRINRFQKKFPELLKKGNH
ncbi:peptide-methionine (S)-S-oxide reductase [Gillisia sp. Hel1_33_143]|uniref:peptide-methionine (S)-S-oxide reductase MsrA n=1 Tax=Gillisia sp. Hel1_33_143 TaxID=1336796 RepID=UPI00087CD2C0|nr:peptide-methionine (S)-S-oxide reductase MsrA [Gillisia sp. Hel1_33_143]SDR66792.1 peptide-methionine (S)-S-oxide reductase [Gillisia sp. Hel1_33_143]